jgi:thiamine biosynthesis lipoprotein
MAAEAADFAMDTVIMYKVFGKQAKEALSASKKETARMEGMLSRFITDSEISKINQAAGKDFIKVSPETYQVLAQALKYSGCCEGRFDVTIGPLAELWRNSKKMLSAPEDRTIKQILPLVNHHELMLHSSSQSVRLSIPGQSIDLGGIGKGFTADRILHILKLYGIKSAFTNFGGNVAAIGSRPDGEPWRVGITHPRSEKELIGAVSIVNKSVVTSGDYQRYFIGKDGRRYHHILDPVTGYPSASGLIGVTVVADSSMMADALSTILFIIGLRKGSELLKTFPGTEAIFIADNLQVYVTEGLKKVFIVNKGIKVSIIS